MLMPTSTTYAANLAPADMRGRYMSIYGLTWGVAQGVGPVMGSAVIGLLTVTNRHRIDRTFLQVLKLSSTQNIKGRRNYLLPFLCAALSSAVTLSRLEVLNRYLDQGDEDLARAYAKASQVNTKLCYRIKRLGLFPGHFAD